MKKHLDKAVPEGTGYRTKTRFAKFYNLPELMAMFKEVADIRTSDTLNLPTPTPHYHNVAVKPSQMQKEMVASLAERAEKYDLEDKIIKYYPQEIAALTEKVKGLKLDLQLANEHPKEVGGSFAGMKIGGISYAEKADAGKALIDACKRKTKAEATPLGEYRGFKTELEFDTFERSYAVLLKGHFTHKVTLGTDIHGNITRMDNVVDGIGARLTKAEEELQNAKAQLETAKCEVEKPFAQEEELQKKLSRLTELNAKLDMDKGDVPTLGDEPDEKPGNTEKSRSDREERC